MKDNKETLGEKKYRDFVLVQVWRFIAVFVIGACGGYLTYRQSVKSGTPNIAYLFTVWGIITGIGLITFIIMILKGKKQLKDQEKKRDELENKDN